MLRAQRLFLYASAMAGSVLLLNLQVGSGGLDSPEIIAAARSLGHVHPPGHPTYLGFSSLFLLIPFGDAAFRLAIFSAVALSLAAGLVALLLDREIVGKRFGQDHDAFRIWILSVWAAISVCVPGVFEQGVRPEVYALEVLLCLLGLFLLLRCRASGSQLRDFWALGLLEGLALAHHHYLSALSLGPVTFWVLFRGPNPFKRTLWVTLGVLCSLMVYLLYWVRDPAASPLYWFDTQSLQGFVDMVVARPFHGSITSDARADIAGNIPLALGMLPRFVGALPFTLGLLGVGFCLWRRRDGDWIVFFVLAGALFSKVVMYADPENPDDRGYLALAMVLWTGLAAALFEPAERLCSRLTRSPYLALGLCLFCVVGIGVERVNASLDFTKHRANTTAFLNQGLSAVPANSLALVHYFQTHFLFQYAQAVEGRRPDIVEAQASFGSRVRKGEDTLKIFARRHPDLEMIVDEIRAHGFLRAAAMVDVAKVRPLVMDPPPEHPELPLDNMSFTSLFARVHWEPQQPVCSPAELRGSLGTLKVRDESSDLLAFSLLEHAVFHLRRGNAPCADTALTMLEEVTGKSPLIDRLRVKSRGLFLRADSSGIVSPSPYRDMPFP